jgi:hypothetical protein
MEWLGTPQPTHPDASVAKCHNISQGCLVGGSARIAGQMDREEWNLPLTEEWVFKLLRLGCLSRWRRLF